MTRGKRRLGTALAVIVVAGGAGAVVVLAREGDGATPRTRPHATVRVVERDLVERETLNGTLRFADPRTLMSRLAGTLTALAPEASVIRRGEVMFRVDGRGVRLLFGRVPAFRTLALGVSDGDDVRQLERNLLAMGYDADGRLELDEEFDEATTDALESWQEDTGDEDTGVLELGTYEFLTGPRRMGPSTLELGAAVAPGTQVATTTATSPEVAVSLAADSSSLVHEGERVRVGLPDGRTVRGTVSHVADVAESPPESEGGGEPTIDVTISLRRHPRAVPDQSPVLVDVASARARDVLAVPVAALVALAEGGFALEVVDADTSRLVRVTPGKYANGWVAVRGDGVRAGLEVVVPDGL